MNSLRLMIVLMLAAIQGCKGPSAGCSGDQKIPYAARIEAGLGTLPQVRQELTSVPTSLQDLYFVDLGGKIVVTPSAAAFCGDEQSRACRRDTATGPVIYLEPSPDPGNSCRGLQSLMAASSSR